MSLFKPRLLPVSQQLKLINDAVGWLTQAREPLKIILYGSAAKQTMHEGSDLDFVILLHDFGEVIVQRELTFARARTFVWPCDLHFMTLDEFENERKKGGWAQIVSQEGKVVFERKSLNEVLK